MSSPLIDIPAAVVTALNGESFSITFQAQRVYVPRFKLEELVSLKVSVVASSTRRAQIARGARQKTYSVDVAIQKQLASPSPALVDPLLALADEIADFFSPGLLGSTGAAWAQTEHDPLWLPDHLKEMSVFTSLITVTYQL